MKVHHFLITRFCYRNYRAEKFKGYQERGDWKPLFDPLSQENLDYRLLLFQALCLPSVLAQTTQNFTWILVVDKDLPVEYQNSLHELVKRRRESYLWEYDKKSDIKGLGWLSPWINSGVEYILTTNLDDDDALPRSFLESTQGHIIESIKNRELKQFKMIATKSSVQWDLISSFSYPLGWQCKWHRRSNIGAWPASAGFTMAGEYPQCELSVYAVDHSICEILFLPLENSNSFQKFLVEQGRKRVIDSVRNSGECYGKWSAKNNYYDLNGDTGSVVISNHYHNQQARLHEKKKKRNKVIKNQSFSDVGIDWEFISANHRCFFKKWTSFSHKNKGSAHKNRAVKGAILALGKILRKISL